MFKPVDVGGDGVGPGGKGNGGQIKRGKYHPMLHIKSVDAGWRRNPDAAPSNIDAQSNIVEYPMHII